MEDFFLPTGGFYFGGGQVRLRTVLGSCVAITLWHPIRRIGGMCHYLLPNQAVPQSMVSAALPGMYADGAMRLFLQSVKESATHPSEYIVKMFGGGNMFNARPETKVCRPPCSTQLRSACRDVPCKNVESGRELLERSGLKLAATDVGGAGSRQLTFELWSGDVWLRRGPELAVAS